MFLAFKMTKQVADGGSPMKYIWAPWRIRYVRGNKQAGCFLCQNPALENDAETYILFRGKYNFIVMNSFPYNPGHLLVAPYRHNGNVEDLSAEERNEHFELVSKSIVALKKALNPGGFNIGSNLGKVAGAGVEDHFHSHIVPRWNGDTNFVPVLSDVRIVPQALADSYKDLKKLFE
jgi:ATP adenylyltransferase